MTPDLAYAVERAPPGDRGPFLRSLARPHVEAMSRILAAGPERDPVTRSRLTRHARALGKVAVLATRYGIPVDGAPHA